MNKITNSAYRGLVFAGRLPRGLQNIQDLRGAIRSQEPTRHSARGGSAAIEELQTVMTDGLQAMADYRARAEERMDEFGASLDELAIRAAAAAAGAGQHSRVIADPDYSKNFKAWVRDGERNPQAAQFLQGQNATDRFKAVHAAMSVGSNSDGGYLAPTEWDRTISKALIPLSPMRRLATVKTTSVNAFSKLWNLRGTGSGWVGETAARPETTSPTMAAIVFGHGEIYANPSVTQRLLDDSELDMEQFLSDEIAEEFTKQESVAFVSGNGTNKPYGFLTFATGAANAALHPGGAILVSTVAGTTTVTPDELVTHAYSLPARYRANATWLMNSGSASVIAKLKDGQGNYIWRESFLVGQPSTLLGRPVEIDENMPAMVTGAIPIAFGDFRAGYLINDRVGIRILRDPFTAKPYVLFYSTKRVGGGVQDPTAIRVIKMA